MKFEHLKSKFTPGSRVRLISMDDPYTKLFPGETGTVVAVDDIGTIHVKWDCGSCLGVVYGEDRCELLKGDENEKV